MKPWDWWLVKVHGVSVPVACQHPLGLSSPGLGRDPLTRWRLWHRGWWRGRTKTGQFAALVLESSSSLVSGRGSSSFPWPFHPSKARQSATRPLGLPASSRHLGAGRVSPVVVVLRDKNNLSRENPLSQTFHWQKEQIPSINKSL